MFNLTNVYLVLVQAKLNILAHKLRSLLAVLGVFIGSAAVVALLYSSHLATLSVVTKLSGLGTNLISVSLLGGSKNAINQDDVAALVAKNNNIVRAAPLVSSYDGISFAGRALTGSVIGVTADFNIVAKLKIASGRFLNDFDKDPYCMIGANLYRQSNRDNLIGSQFKIANNYCTIIAVLAPSRENFFIPVNINNSVILPITVLQKFSKHNIIRDVVFSLSSSDVVASVTSYLQQEIKAEHPKVDTFFRSPAELIHQIKKQQRQLNILLIVIAGISLLVGGIGIMNIMLVSVLERRREIGLRLALGACPRDICAMFLVEAILLSFIGGFLGVIAGVLFSVATAWISNWPVIFLALPIFLGFIVSFLVGVFFGFYPAYKAAKLNPIESMLA